ncbi:MAG: hypothetical protein A3F82_10200 [Deltaproteobacteria bacterium RIFCSPLOWO2_12_FULL_44_12]|nr:MAG: hypothetical protein A2712_00130 [Deltaproteobacteria bacterium RIFCSPHIGHO2_01_FULL_43_49]OGQ15827.1 MAG: hypothetical protein A3D22_02780 [Deltaproteobacteria bacterium RIFCSPHIGHO2_02_FULL_44_53]OGQ28781.1 MAG: hypothetical protein A3D98_01110 [Deltaproteobacteria bacterium RIFCSPHIGHO2_12_FULL_44_21]OGQ32101.1 MAG: hypothetical protein A2979_03235 [Deltaproteobacteria bacterium RIFCSPLOWO2_01_FULL_45_74]OGQ43756.1 MAG: hypothetical protein A3I70_05755 [Deltaproteobacteria bacterium 
MEMVVLNIANSNPVVAMEIQIQVKLAIKALPTAIHKRVLAKPIVLVLFNRQKLLCQHNHAVLKSLIAPKWQLNCHLTMRYLTPQLSSPMFLTNRFLSSPAPVAANQDLSTMRQKRWLRMENLNSVIAT